MSGGDDQTQSAVINTVAIPAPEVSTVSGGTSAAQPVSMTHSMHDHISGEHGISASGLIVSPDLTNTVTERVP